MKILFISDNFYPEISTAGYGVYERAKHWVSSGHDVTIITSFPNYPKGIVYPGYKNKLYKVEYIDGIRVIRVKTFIAENKGFVLRIIDHISFMISSIIASLFLKKPDVVIATSPQFFTAVSGFITSIIKFRPFIFEVRDLWPESIAAVGTLRKDSFIYKLIEKIEMFLYKRAKKVVCLTFAFKDNLIKRGINPNKISVIRNGIELDSFSPIAKDKELTSNLNLKDKFVVGYIGTTGMAHNLLNVLQSAKIIQEKDDNVRIVIVGDGAEKDKLIAYKSDNNIDNVYILPSVPKSEIKKYWSICDIALVHLKDYPLFKTVIPSKIFEAMRMGLPILLACPKGESSQIIEDENIGINVSSSCPNLLAESILKLSKDSSLVELYCNNAFKASENYSRKQQAYKMIELAESILN